MRSEPNLCNKASFLPYLVGDMMKVTRVVAVAVTIASFGVGLSHAQNLRDVQAPAEFPPASYKGTQYVDSKGCVYIRAGIDGNVTWVPRVNRQRQLLCGQTPSRVAQGAPAAAPAAAAPVQITVAPPAPAPAAQAPAPRVATAPAAKPAPVKPAPTPRVSTTPAPKPAPRVVVRRPAVVAPVARATPAPKVVKAPPAKAAPQPRTVAKTVTVRTRQAACPGASPISQRYINSGTDLPVRCGPQTIRPVAGAATTATAGTVVTQQTRVVPRHVYDNRRADTVTQPPAGYRAVWEDDRLNPRRAEQTLEGIARSRLIWTQTVPRRLIERNTGRDVTSTVALVYPYTDMATQQRDLGTVTIVRRDGLLMKRIMRNGSAPVRQPTVSTRSAPAPVIQPKAKAQAQPAKPKAVTRGQYVQVGMFGSDANAKAAAQRLARTGLPARMGTLKRGGKSYRLVLAGPFDSAEKTRRALGQARQAGFNDAFVRK